MPDLGTCTISEIISGNIKKIRFDWTSDADGNVLKTTTNYYTGKVVEAYFAPSDGINQPNSEYVLQILDGNNVDALKWVRIWFLMTDQSGNNIVAENQDNFITSINYSGYTDSELLGSIANEKLTLSITNAGNTKSGTTIIFVR